MKNLLKDILASSIVFAVLAGSSEGSGSPTATPTTRAPTTPTAAPTMGCVDTDKTSWEAGYFVAFNETMDYCGNKAAGDYAKSLTCFEGKFPDFSKSCIECHITLVQCTKNSCLGKCIDGGQENPLCVSCVEQFCNDAYRACTGFDPAICATCKAPSTSIVPGLPDGGLYGIIAGGGVVLLGGVAFCVFRARRGGKLQTSPSSPSHGGQTLTSNSSAGKLVAPGATPGLQQQASFGNMPGAFVQQPQQQQMYMMNPYQQQQMYQMNPYQQQQMYQQQMMNQQFSYQMPR